MKNKKVNLNDICFFQEGPGVRKHQYCTKGVKLINVSNLVNGEVDLSNSNRYISQEEAYGRYKHFLIDEGDLIIASSGIKVEYLDKKVAFIKKENLPLCMNTSTIRFKVKNKNELDILYLSYFLKSKNFKNQISKLITGSAQLNFGGSHLKKINLFLPELNVQKKVSTLLLLIDNTIKNMQRKISILEQLTKSLFNFQIQPYIKELKIEKLGDIIEVKSSKRVFLSEISTNGIPFYRGTEISKLSRGENVESNLFISEELYENLRKISDVPKIGDLLLPSICNNGEIWYVNKSNPFYFKDGRVLWLKLNKNINGKYLQYYLIEKFKRDYFKIASGTTFSELKIITLKNLLLPVPPIELQNKFAEKVEKIEKLKFIISAIILKPYKTTINKGVKGV